jgi:hypothetical protein
MALMAVIGLQVAVPLFAMLFQEPPARFAFPMYSGQGLVDVVIQDAHGKEVPFEAGTVIAGFRPELNWVDHLPEYLCRAVPTAHTVTVVQKGRTSRLICD